MRDTYHIGELCQALQVSQSGYYAARGHTPGPRQQGDEQLLVAIQEIHSHRHTCCYDNPLAESLFALIKSDLLPEDDIFQSKSEAHTVIFDYLECFYNRRRFHLDLGYQSP